MEQGHARELVSIDFCLDKQLSIGCVKSHCHACEPNVGSPVSAQDARVVTNSGARLEHIVGRLVGLGQIECGNKPSPAISPRVLHAIAHLCGHDVGLDVTVTDLHQLEFSISP